MVRICNPSPTLIFLYWDLFPLGFEQSGLFRDQRKVPSRTRGWGRGIWTGGGFKRSGKSKIFHLISLLRVDPYAALWTLLDPGESLFICVPKVRSVIFKIPFSHFPFLFMRRTLPVRSFLKWFVFVKCFTFTKTNSHYFRHRVPVCGTVPQNRIRTKL